jgi:chromate transporter
VDYKENMMIYWQLFYTFFKIGLFSFGGGYGMLSLIQYEVVVNHGWLTNAELADILAISQMTPGPISINSATYIGYTASGSICGSALATFAISLPSFIIMLIVCRMAARFKSNKYVAAAFLGLRPMVVGLIAAAALLLLTGDNFIDYKSIIIFAAAFVAVWRFKLHPILMILLAGGVGLLLY